MSKKSTHEPIAITGVGCRLPGGVTCASEFWKLMLDGVDAVTEIPSDRWSVDRYYDPEPRPGKSYSKWGGFLDAIDQFDADYFGISDDEAKSMDPQQRLLLETSREAMDEAGQVGTESSPTGVFVGTSTHDYELIQSPATSNRVVGQYAATGTSASCIIANRLSYVYNLTGPSVAVDTACSSSLIAVHFACQSIWNGQCNSAIAAGVNLIILPSTFSAFSVMKMLSPEGRCKAFDAAANGFVRGEGVGVMYLRPLSEAIADGDLIYATIMGTGSNQDGRTAGMTFPNTDSQASLIRSVCAESNIKPNQIDYMEAHGTGTLAGDEAESAALGNTMGKGRSEGNPLPVGSVKTNIGHLESGAGMAGIIKAAMVLKNRQIPPNLHFNTPNPSIDFDKLGLKIPTETERLNHRKKKHLSAVNSFGFGGTNAFALLQSYPQPVKAATTDKTGDPEPILLPLSSNTEEGLQETARIYADRIKEKGNGTLGDIAFTTAVRRKHHAHRLTAIGRDPKSIAQSLNDFSNGDPAGLIEHDCLEEGDLRGPVFVFSGQGPQWWAMGQEMIKSERVFRDTLTACHKAMAKLKPGWSLWDEFHATDEKTSRVADTAVSQPAIFALQVAVARQMEHWGITPAAVVGHSVGEVAAAHIAGVYDLDDAMKVIFHRGRTMSEAREGSMLAAALTEDQARDLVENEGGCLSLAAVNSPKSVTIAGTGEEIASLSKQLDEDQVWNRVVPVNYAFHSSLMDPVKEPLLEALDGLEGKPAQIPIYSTVSGKQMDGSEFTAEYWWDNVRQSVLFSPAISEIGNQTGYDVFVEIAPHPALSRSISECAPGATVITTLKRNPDLFPERTDSVEGTVEPESLLQALGKLFCLGWPVKWENLSCLDGAKTVPLPAYAWQRKRYWMEDSISKSNRLSDLPHPYLSKRQHVKEATWQCRADLRLFAYLGDHVVQKHTLFPAAGFLELALAVGAEHLGETSLCLEDFEIDRALILSTLTDRITQIEVQCQPGNYFVCHSRPDTDSENWSSHARCAIRRIGEHVESRIDMEELRKDWREISVPEFYEEMREQDYHYGPMFQSLKQLWAGSSESLGHARLHDNLVKDADKYHLHPVLLDACLQLVGAIFSGTDKGNEAFLPVGFEQVRLYKPIGSEVWGYARIIDRIPTGALADVTLMDSDGLIMAEIRGFRLQLAPGANQEESLFYGYEWESVERKAKSSGDAESDSDTKEEVSWLILGEPDETREAVAEGLRAQDQAVVSSGKFEDGHDNLLYLAGDGGSIESESLSVLALVKELSKSEPGSGFKLFIVTRHGFDTGLPDDDINLDHAPVTGLRRVIFNEHPGWNCRLIDWDGTSNLDNLIAELLQSEQNDDDEVALREDERLVPRLDNISPREWDLAGVGKPDELPSRWIPGDVKSIDQLQLVTIDRKKPGTKEVEVEVVAAGLNFRDVMKTLGMYPGDAADANVLGDEFSGIITRVGKKVTNYKKGDRVIGIATGALATHLTVHEGMIVELPDFITLEEGVTFPESFLTSGHALCELAKIQKGERVLIHSATGGVGLAAVQFALLAECEVFGTAGNPEKREYLKSLGVHHVMDSRSLDFADDVRRITNNEGVDVVLNSLAGEAMIRSMELLRVDGRFLELGKRDIYGGTAISLMPFRNGLTYFAIDLSRRMTPDKMGVMLKNMASKIESKEITPLPRTAFSFAEAPEGFRYMAQGKHIGKNIFTLEDTLLAPRKPQISGRASLNSAGTYLITGGLKGLGLALAEQLVERGCQHLVLTSKSGTISTETRETLAEFQQAGVKVVTKKSDSSKQEEVISLLDTINKEMPPLKGIIHAAAVYQDAMLVNQDEESFHLSMGPKAEGAWHLHTQTQSMDDLDFFVMLSSVSATVGNPGQGNYVAANTYCDALAKLRQRNGLPAVSIALEHVIDAGYASRNEKVADHLKRMEMKGITSKQIMEGLDTILIRDQYPPNLVLMTSSRWINAGARIGVLRRSPRFERIASDEEDNSDQNDLRETLHMAREGERDQILIKFLQQQIGEIIRVTPSRLPLDQPINEIGLDSLMMVEFGTRVEMKLGGAIPVASLADPPSILGLADLVLEQMFGESTVKKAKKADPEADCLLGKEIEVIGDAFEPYQVTAPKIVLLTGATGFLGAHLLMDLFGQVKGSIVCLVRADDEESGKERILSNLKKYGLSLSEDQLDRLKILIGDVSQPMLGLSSEIYDQLSTEIDAIYHCAAAVNFLHSYEKLRNSNVMGTLEVLRFAAVGRLKPLHHMSTLAIFGSQEIETGNIICEENRSHFSAGSGYGETKRVTETIVHELAGRGLPVTVYRTGFVIGSGLFDESDGDEVYWRIIRSAITLGIAPESDCELHLSRVETVAGSLAWLSIQADCHGQTHHLLGKDRLSLQDFFNVAIKKGYEIENVDTETWINTLRDAAALLMDDSLSVFTKVYSLADIGIPELLGRNQVVSSEATDELLADSGVKHEPIDEELINRYLTSFAEKELI